MVSPKPFCQRSMLLIAILLALLFLSGCTGFTGRGKTRASPYTFHTGTQGMMLEFLPGSPPDRLYEGDPLTLVVKYANKGAYIVEGGRLYVSGYDRTYIPLIPDHAPFNAE